MQDRNLTEGLEIRSALSSGSYRKVKYKRMRVSRLGMLIVHNLLWGARSTILFRPVDMLETVCATTPTRPLADAVSCTNPREYRIVPEVPH